MFKENICLKKTQHCFEHSIYLEAVSNLDIHFQNSYYDVHTL